MHCWRSYISFASVCKQLACMLDPLLYIRGYQVCALNHTKVGDADLDYPSEPCHRNEEHLSPPGHSHQCGNSTGMASHPHRPKEIWALFSTAQSSA